MLVDVEEHKQGMRPAEELNRSIFLTFFLVLNLESALNDGLLLLQAPKLVDLLRMCELIELHTAVPPYVRRQTLRFAWALVAFQVRSMPSASMKVLLVDQVRVQLSLIKNCVDMVSTLVGPSLLYAYAYSVAILCVSAYYTIIPELKLPVRIFFFFFALLHFLSILLPPIMAQRMNTAVRVT
ncbi:hypothetical protein V5799_014594 [Amblyomma americanum]|uniref:Uncharacterized protein n=1 Tax=Amblyomma americanum TaxID=6943 RepID=A0AAQ4E2K1_AMBAM